jgi:NADPH-dependent 2,4-dienoyl-CoA reductase/sulfur reductase-like enzyme
MSSPARVVIVGGGIGGVSTAAALRAGGFEGDIVLIDAAEWPHDRPPLSKEYLAGTRSLDEIALEQPAWYDDHAVRLVNGTRAVALRPGEGLVEAADGRTFEADRVVLATGGRAAAPPIPGADGDRVHVLRTVEDADRLRDGVTSGTRVLVVGAGLIGAEATSTVTGLGAQVTLVEAASPPLTQAVGAEVATWLHDVHRQHGVTVLDGSVERFEAVGGAIRAVFTGAHGTGDFDRVLLALGMVPDTDLARAAGLGVGRGVVVDAWQVTTNPAVLAIGDTTELRVDGVAVPRGEHWEAARLDGERAAATILGTPPPAPTAGWFWTDRHGLHVEVVGTMSAAERVLVRGVVGTPPFSAFAVRDHEVVGAVAVDDPKAVRAARRMIDRRVRVDPEALADQTTDLRRLLRATGP